MDRNDKRNQSGGMFGRTTEEFAVRSATSGVGWNMGEVAPAFPCYVGLDDQLLVQVAANVSALPCFVNVRMLGLDGLIHPLQLQFTPAVGRVFTPKTFNLMEGWILSLNILTPGAPIGPGQWMFATAAIVRAPLGVGNQYDVLVAGYMSNNVGLSYPFSQMQRSTDGQGTMLIVNQSAPAAGADLSIAVPGGAIWRLMSFRATLTTAVAVANRLVSIAALTGATPTMESPSNFTQAASIVNTYNAFDSCPYQNVPFNLRTNQPLPSNLFLNSQHTIQTVTTGIQAADQWSAAAMLVMEWKNEN